MAGNLRWEVTGRGSFGGIVVREGRQLSSREEPTRLGTGSIIRQIRLEGDRLQYERISGLGPVSGWVSVKVKDRAVVVRTVRTSRLMPVCMCFYTMLNKSNGRSQWNFWMNMAKKEGLKDFVIGDQIGEEGYRDCKDFDDYTNRLVSKIDENPNHCGRPVVIVAHGTGCLAAWGTAMKLGRRCLKLYVVANRPPNNALLDEGFNVNSAAQLQAMDDSSVFKCLLEGWPWVFKDLVDGSLARHGALWQRALAASKLCKQQVGTSVVPHGSTENQRFCGEDRAIAAPIMALAAENENQKGETAQKMLEWKSFTRRPKSFNLIVFPGVDHMSIMWALSPALKAILCDMTQLLANRAWMQKEAQAVNQNLSS